MGQTGCVKGRNALAGVITMLFCLAGLASAGGDIATAALRSVQQADLKVVALGDSVTSGVNCRCTAFPHQYGRLLAARTGESVAVDNQGVSGMDSAGLLDQLNHRNSGISQAVKTANLVLLVIGANDFAGHENAVARGSCTPAAPGGGCVGDELRRLPTHLHEILSRIRSLRPGAEVLMAGYWNVFKDGQVARNKYTAAGVEASVALTRAANLAIADVARSDGAQYVDIFSPFEKPGLDTTTLLASDGDHPNAAGHLLIAETFAAAGVPDLVPAAG